MAPPPTTHESASAPLGAAKSAFAPQAPRKPIPLPKRGSLQYLIFHYSTKVTGRGMAFNAVIQQFIADDILSGELSLGCFQDFLIAHTDFQRGIETERGDIVPFTPQSASCEQAESKEEETSAAATTKPKSVSAYVRKFCLAKKSLEDRPLPNDPLIEVNNLLLRCLGTARGINHVLEQRGLGQEGNNLLAKFSQLVRDLAYSGPNFDAYYEGLLGKMAALEHQFYGDLLVILAKNDLLSGITTREEAGKLLIRYRYLASTLDPMPAIQTSYEDKLRTCTKTSWPVTQKLPEQKTAMSKMESVDPYPDKVDQNDHTAQPEAFQIAQAAFVDLLMKDDRQLGAQARSFMMDSGVLNAFVNQVEVKQKVSSRETGSVSNPYITSALPAYVGTGESDENIQAALRRNLGQLQKAVGQKKLHIVSLLTKSWFKKKEARGFDLMGKLKWSPFSLVSVNEEGLSSASQPTDFLRDRPAFGLSLYDPKAYRSKLAAMAAGLTGLGMPVIHCMAGQDRTQVVATEMDIAFLENELRHTSMLREDALPVRVLAEHTIAMMAHHPLQTMIAAPGSPGIKPLSRAGWLFSSSLNNHWFSRSALTNKLTLRDNALFAKAFDEKYKRARSKLRSAVQNEGVLRDTVISLCQMTDAIQAEFPGESALLADVLYRTHALVTTVLGGKKAPLKQVQTYARFGLDLQKRNCHKRVLANRWMALGVLMVLVSVPFIPLTGGASLGGVLLGLKCLTVGTTIGALSVTGTLSTSAVSATKSVRLYQVASDYHPVEAKMGEVLQKLPSATPS